MALLGGGFGWLRFGMLSVHAIPDKKILVMPGTWMLALILLFTFIARFIFGYVPHFTTAYFHSHAFNLHMITMYGFLSGFFTGRTARASYIAKYGPFINLQDNPTSPAH